MKDVLNRTEWLICPAPQMLEQQERKKALVYLRRGHKDFTTQSHDVDPSIVNDR